MHQDWKKLTFPRRNVVSPGEMMTSASDFRWEVNSILLSSICCDYFLRRCLPRFSFFSRNSPQVDGVSFLEWSPSSDFPFFYRFLREWRRGLVSPLRLPDVAAWPRWSAPRFSGNTSSSPFLQSPPWSISISCSRFVELSDNVNSNATYSFSCIYTVVLSKCFSYCLWT